MQLVIPWCSLLIGSRRCDKDQTSTGAKFSRQNAPSSKFKAIEYQGVTVGPNINKTGQNELALFPSHVAHPTAKGPVSQSVPYAMETSCLVSEIVWSFAGTGKPCLQGRDGGCPRERLRHSELSRSTHPAWLGPAPR